MTEEGAEEKDDSKETEKTKKKKEKKEKKKKEPKEKKPKGPNCVETLSAGLNMTDRDGKSINTDVCVSKDPYVLFKHLHVKTSMSIFQKNIL